MINARAKTIRERAQLALNGDHVDQLKALALIVALAQEIIDTCEGY